MFEGAYELVRSDDGNYTARIMARGLAVLGSPMINRGTAFTPEQRRELGLTGLLPSGVSTLDGQLRRTYAQYSRQSSNLAKWVYLTNLRSRNEVLFYKLLSEHIEEMLRRAVLNLTLNALDAMPDGGEIVATGVSGARTVELEIADSGPGMSSETKMHALEPFYTTKSTGTGLGLSICKQIVEQHGGTIAIESTRGHGTRVTVDFPARDAMAEAPWR